MIGRSSCVRRTCGISDASGNFFSSCSASLGRPTPGVSRVPPPPTGRGATINLGGNLGDVACSSSEHGPPYLENNKKTFSRNVSKLVSNLRGEKRTKILSRSPARGENIRRLAREGNLDFLFLISQRRCARHPRAPRSPGTFALGTCLWPRGPRPPRGTPRTNRDGLPPAPIKFSPLLSHNSISARVRRA